MATLNGAKAMGIDHITGSLETGKAADITAVAFDELEAMPLYNPASQLVYSNNSHRVTHSWVNGKCLLRDRELQTLSEHEIITKAQRWQQKIADKQ